ncbi:hypothetical protein, partial [Bacillus cereus]
MKKEKGRQWYRQLIQLIVVALIVTSIPLNGLAETAPAGNSCPSFFSTSGVCSEFGDGVNGGAVSANPFSGIEVTI